MKFRTIQPDVVREFLKLVYPTFVTWSLQYDYSIPSIPVLLEYTLKFAQVESYPSTYNGEAITAIGTHNASTKTIQVASDRSRRSILDTLVHEYAHAIQFFNLGNKFHVEYAQQAKTLGHSENAFENQARVMGRKLTKAMDNDIHIRIALNNFEFKFAAKPGPKPSKHKKSREERRIAFRKQAKQQGGRYHYYMREMPTEPWLDRKEWWNY